MASESVRPWKKRLRIAFRVVGLIFVSLLLIDGICVLLGRRLTRARDTTYITSPTVDGYPDYLAYLNQMRGVGITTNANAAIPLLEVVGTGGMTDAKVKEIYRYWGIPQPVKRPLFEPYPQWAPGQALPAGAAMPDKDALQAELVLGTKGPWKAADHPLLAKWINAATPALDALDKASQKPQFFIPLVSDDGHSGDAPGFLIEIDDGKTLGNLKILSNAELIRANEELQAGDAPAFEHDVLTCMRLSRLLARQPTLIDYLVGLGIDSASLEAVQVGAAGALGGLESKRLRAQIDVLPPYPSPTNYINVSERFNVLDAICAIRRKGPSAFHEAISAVAGMPGIPVDYNGSLREANRIYDRMAKLFDLPDYSGQRHEMDAVFTLIDGRMGPGGLHWSRIPYMYEDFFAAIMVPTIRRLVVLNAEHVVDRDLVESALALREMKTNTGAFPATLGGLKAVGFNAPPDYFTGKSLIYQCQGAGYLLYSVDEDLHDDGGKPRSQRAPGVTTDIVVRAEK